MADALSQSVAFLMALQGATDLMEIHVIKSHIPAPGISLKKDGGGGREKRERRREKKKKRCLKPLARDKGMDMFLLSPLISDV